MPLYCQRFLALRLETKHLVDGGMLHATEDDIWKGHLLLVNVVQLSMFVHLMVTGSRVLLKK